MSCVHFSVCVRTFLTLYNGRDHAMNVALRLLHLCIFDTVSLTFTSVQFIWLVKHLLNHPT